jgi:hypothetical protein
MSDDSVRSAGYDAGPYARLDAHVISVKALYCEDGCGFVAPSGYGDDIDVAKELAGEGWQVRPHSMGGLAALCKDCVARYDAEHPALASCGHPYAEPTCPTSPGTPAGGES